MKQLFGVVFACMVAVVLSISASAAESPPAQEAEASQDPLIASGFWERDDLDDMTGQEMDDAICEILQEAGYTEGVVAQSIEEISEGIPQEIYDLAYSDIDQADEETKAEILKARNWFIYSCSWSDDGTGLRISPSTRTFWRAPKFSDLFPGWDLPVAEDYAGKNQEVTAPAEEVDSAHKDTEAEIKEKPVVHGLLEEENAKLEEKNDFAPDSAKGETSSAEPRMNLITRTYSHVFVKKKVAGSGITSSFVDFYTLAPNADNPVTVNVDSLPSYMPTCNIGLTNEYSGNNLYFWMDVPEGDKVTRRVNSSECSHIGIRLSTKYDSGYGTFTVTRRNDET